MWTIPFNSLSSFSSRGKIRRCFKEDGREEREEEEEEREEEEEEEEEEEGRVVFK